MSPTLWPSLHQEPRSKWNEDAGDHNVEAGLARQEFDSDDRARDNAGQGSED